MTPSPEHQKDPFGWTAAITLVFLVLCLIRLTIPTKLFFDEVHYVPAARTLLALTGPVNREHPMLGKEILAVGIALFGDKPLGWRIFPALFGVLALFSFARAMWFASLSRFATIAGAILLATAIPLFLQSRIAMLDIFMFSFTMVGLWLTAAAVREPEKARWRLAGAGVALGLAMASKWNAIPVAMLPGLAFLGFRVWSARGKFLTATRAAPIPGIGLGEAFVWLGVVPLLAYALTFMPVYFYANHPMGEVGIIGYHKEMLSLQMQKLHPHPYQSTWPQWVLNARGIWYLYENVDGAQRGVVMLGNPLTMLLGLPALLWCIWAGFEHRRYDALAVAALYLASLGFWMLAAKSVEFYYHYFLPSAFLMAALALALEEVWRRWSRVGPLLALAGAVAMFAWFYPILSAAKLAGPQSYNTWMWYKGWR